MDNTIEEFWKMVYEKDVAVIVMLSELEEDGKVALFQCRIISYETRHLIPVIYTLLIMWY